MIAARSVRRLASCERGAALIEFAFALPVLLALYLMGYSVSDEIACDRKVTIAARSVADLVSQNTTGSTSAAEVNSDLAAATQVLAPYNIAKATVRVSEIATNTALQTTVIWSQSLNGTPLATGSTVAIPTSMAIPGSYYLLAELNYAYTPVIGGRYVAPIPMADHIYMVPRNTAQISCADCS